MWDLTWDFGIGTFVHKSKEMSINVALCRSVGKKKMRVIFRRMGQCADLSPGTR